MKRTMEIIAPMSGGDLVVTGDLPLTNDVIQERVKSTLGTVYDEENIDPTCLEGICWRICATVVLFLEGPRSKKNVRVR